MAVTQDGWDDNDSHLDVRLLLNDVAKNNRINEPFQAQTSEILAASVPLNYGTTAILGNAADPAFFQLPPAVPQRRIALIPSLIGAGIVTLLLDGTDTSNGDGVSVTWNMSVGFPLVMTCTTAGDWVSNIGVN